MITLTEHYQTLGESVLIHQGAEAIPSLFHWNAYNSCPRAVDTTEKHSGAQSMKYTTNSTTVSQGYIGWTQRVVQRGTWVVGGWVKCSLAGQMLRVEGRYATASTGVSLGQGQGLKDFPATGDWQPFESNPFVYATAPAGRPACVANTVRTANLLAPVGTNIWVDDVYVRQVG